MSGSVADEEAVENAVNIAGDIARKWRQGLTLLEVDHTSRLSRRHNQIRLPGEERGDLQHVDGRRRGRRLRRFVDVGQDRDPHALFDPGEHPEPFLQAWPTKGPERRAIRLVE